MFDDVAKDIKAALYDRARSPLFVAFVAAWVVWNFKGIVVLFSDAAIDIKLGIWSDWYGTTTPLILGSEVFDIYWKAIQRLFLYPLLTSVTFILLYPWPARWTFHYWQWHHTKVKKIQQELEDKTPMTREEEKTLRLASLEQQAVMHQQLATLSSVNQDLIRQRDAAVERLSSLDSEAKAQEAAAEELRAELSVAQDQLLQKTQAVEQKSAALEKIKREFSEYQNKNPAEKPAPESGDQARTPMQILMGPPYRMTEEEARVFMGLVRADGGPIEVPTLANRMSANKIDVEVALNSLGNKSLVIHTNGVAMLQTQGKTLAVKERLTKR